MKWVTRERVKVDRVACPWLIKKFVDPEAEFLFVPPDKSTQSPSAKARRRTTSPMWSLATTTGKCSFEAIVSKYAIDEPAVQLLAQIVHGADVAEDLYGRPEAPGLKAIAEGFQQMGLKDDHEILRLEFPLYDALYVYCQRRAET